MEYNTMIKKRLYTVPSGERFKLKEDTSLYWLSKGEYNKKFVLTVPESEPDNVAKERLRPRDMLIFID